MFYNELSYLLIILIADAYYIIKYILYYIDIHLKGMEYQYINIYIYMYTIYCIQYMVGCIYIYTVKNKGITL